MFNLNCQFSEPVELGENDFEYSIMNCTGFEPTSTIALIQNQETGAEFYLEKTINYGEILILVFFLLFTIFGIIKIIADFWIPQRVIRKS